MRNIILRNVGTALTLAVLATSNGLLIIGWVGGILFGTTRTEEDYPSNFVLITGILVLVFTIIVIKAIISVFERRMQ